MRITLIRHGESESNVTGHWQGQGDSPLSPLGREQAQLLSRRLASAHFDHLVGSDLSRARDTGVAVASRHGRTLQTDPVWREINVGEWEGLTRDQVAERFPKQVEALARGEMIKIGGGESWADLGNRALEALEDLRARMKANEHAAVFCHGGVIGAVVTQLFGLEPRRPRRLGNVNNTAITTLSFEPGQTRLERYNDTLHLGPVGKWGTQRLANGCTVVSLWSDEAPANYEVPKVLHESAAVPEGADPMEWLAGKHPGERVALQAPADRIAAITEEILTPEVAGAPRGVTHIVASERGHTLASLHCGPV
ncbi:MAG: histidine phosphatase family protein [Myxococcota bacterium]